jgi:hypothetical protein
MLPIQRVYQIWRERLRAVQGSLCASQAQNLVWLIAGLYLSRSVHLSYIARKLPFRAQKLSIERRLRRWLDNPAIRVRPLYEATARCLLQSAGQSGSIALVIDSSKVSFGHRLLMVGVAYQRRVLPIAWTWTRSQFAHSTAHKQSALLDYVRRLVPPGCRVSLVGDGEFGTSRLVRDLQSWGWDYVLRESGRTSLSADRQRWRRFEALGLKPGVSVWWGSLQVTRSDPMVTAVVLHWQRGERRPWYLVTNQPGLPGAIRLYRRRMWIEELFGDLKRHGFDLEASHLRHFLRLSRLVLVVCWLYLWLLSLGQWLTQHHLTATVDRSDRRDLSLMRLGWDYLERCLALEDPIPLTALPDFTSLSGS